MLQSLLFSYGDAQRYRLGVNHHHIPVNAPKCPFNSFHRDGAMRVDGNHGSTLSYEPNSKGEWQEQPDFQSRRSAWKVRPITGTTASTRTITRSRAICSA